jgi:hypothetical protein
MTLPALTEPTRSAFWAFDEPRYFGPRVFEQLAGRETWTGLMALSIFGRRLPPDLCGVLDDAVGALTLADPRIWPLKLTRVVGSYGGFLPALCAGMLMENGAHIGPWACVDASNVLRALHAEIAGRQDDPAVVREVVAAYRKEHRFVWGFGTPYRGRDERVVSFRECMKRRGRTELPYYTSDVGALVVALVQHMFFAHAMESSNTPNPDVRKLPSEYVTYRGREPRKSPRAVAAEGTGASGISPV